MVLGMPSYLIHGTNKPAGVGMRVSHGCVRLFPENIERLFSEVPVGAAVTIVDQPWLFGWDDHRLYFEAHEPLEDDIRDWPGMLSGLTERALKGAPHQIAGPPEKATLDGIAADGLGIPLPVLAGEPSSESYLQNAMVVNNVVVLPPDFREQVAQKSSP